MLDRIKGETDLAVEHRDLPSVSSLKQFSAFLIVGVISASATLLTRRSFNFIIPYEAAVVASQIVGILIAFNLNRLFVFPNRISFPLHRFGRFALVNVMSLAIAAGVSSLCFRAILPLLAIDFYPAVLAQAIGLGACAVPSFVAHRQFSFGLIDAGSRA